MSAPLPLHILQVNLSDVGSGAERIAWTLFKGYQRAGHRSSLAVGIRHSADPDVLQIPNAEAYRGWQRWWWNLHVALLKRRNRPRGTWRLARVARLIGEPAALGDEVRGLEDYRHRGLAALVNRLSPAPDIIHFHTLHGQYLDLGSVSEISRRWPVVLTLHDEWPYTGYCIYSVTCDRWRMGCGTCPLLGSRPSVVPRALRRDGTHANWVDKREIYQDSRLYVAAPSAWLLNRAEQSVLAPAIAGRRVVPNGVDTAIFAPRQQQEARAQVGVPADALVVLAAAASLRGNPLKGFSMVRDAARQAANAMPGRRVILVALGAAGPRENLAEIEVRYVPFTRDLQLIAAHYQAADVYAHGAVADNFPTTVLEALACGVPVVATAVGGIPEQIDGAALPGLSFELEGRALNRAEHPDADGILVPPHDVDAMGRAIACLLADVHLRHALGLRASAAAHRKFSLQRMVTAYLELYSEALALGDQRSAPSK